MVVTTTVRLITRNDTSLTVALIAATVVVFRQPLHYILDFTREIEEHFHLDLVPALMLLVVVFTFHQYRRRMQARAEALAAEADAARARAQSRTLQQLMALGQSLADALDRTALQQVLWKHLPRFARDRKFWVLLRRVDHWEVLLQDRTDTRPSLDRIEQLATRTLAGDARSADAGAPATEDVCFPMLAAGAVVGMIGVSGASTLTEEQHSVLGAAAAVTAIGVKNMQLFQDVRELSLRDGLTGCFNRGHALQALDTELRRVRRSGSPLSILMFDVDLFKAVNDRFGHLRGDEVLATIGARLGRIMRSSDLRCRYGGDEFLVIMPETPILGARQVAEGLRQDISSLTIGDDDRPPVTISIGLAVAVPGDLDATALIARADAALYRAKRAGGNQVCAGLQPSPSELRGGSASGDGRRAQMRAVPVSARAG